MEHEWEQIMGILLGPEQQTEHVVDADAEMEMPYGYEVKLVGNCLSHDYGEG
jgi:hypothetical protein